MPSRICAITLLVEVKPASVVAAPLDTQRHTVKMDLVVSGHVQGPAELNLTQFTLDAISRQARMALR